MSFMLLLYFSAAKKSSWGLDNSRQLKKKLYSGTERVSVKSGISSNMQHVAQNAVLAFPREGKAQSVGFLCFELYALRYVFKVDCCTVHRCWTQTSYSSPFLGRKGSTLHLSWHCASCYCIKAASGFHLGYLKWLGYVYTILQSAALIHHRPPCPYQHGVCMLGLIKALGCCVTEFLSQSLL